MADELLSEIVAAEREIRRQLSLLKGESETRLATARAGAEEALRREAARLDAEFARAMEAVAREARQESLAEVAAAEAYVARLDSLETEMLDRLIVRRLRDLVREEGHDRPDEQA